jgi:uncharacterized protein YukE
MTERIAVNFATMQHGAGQLRMTMSQIYGLLEKLDGDVRPLRDSWVGTGDSEAAQSYDASRARLQAYVDSMSEMIGRFGTTTADASDYQQVVERNIRDMFPA